MKKRIVIEIEYHDCDTINITQADLMTIQNEVLNQLCIVEDVAGGRYEIDAKVTEPIDENKLDELAIKYSDKDIEDFQTDECWSHCADDIVCSAREEEAYDGACV